MNAPEDSRAASARFFALSSDLLCIVGFDRRYRSVNPAWTQVLGWTEEELLGRDLIELVHPDDQAATLEWRRRHLAGEVVRHFENRYRCKDGSYRWLLWTSTPVEAEQLTYAVAKDITGRRERDDLFDRTQRIAHVGSWDWSAEDRVARWSAELRRIYGVGDEVEATFERIVALIHPDDRAHFVEISNSAVETGEPFELEYRVLRPDGEERLLRERGEPVVGAQGETVRMVGTTLDITEQRATERELVQTERRFRQLAEQIRGSSG